ncbi:MAG: hypothetical protein L6Q37_11545, partial [Bdellovibrionaceae bacterium]|nr:hypothetical protein [Pseudobdellovibrionaceae bacterium]
MKNLRSVMIGTISFFLGACITLPNSFVSDGDTLVHKPTATRYPKKIQGWNLLEGSRDKIDSEIAASASYKQASFSKAFNADFIPVASVYIFSSEKSNGVEVLKKRLKAQIPGAIQERQETIKTPGGTATAIVYKHIAGAAVTSLISQAFETESWLIQSPTQKQVAYWITVAKGDKDRQSIPTEFLTRYDEG